MREEIEEHDILTVPNAVTAARLPFAIIAIIFLDTPWALLFLGLAILSDAVDGYVARRLDQKSRFGAVLDPVVDKLVVALLFFALFSRAGAGYVHGLIFFARDIFVVGMALTTPFITLPDREVLKARFPGKLVTVAQFTVLTALFLTSYQLFEPLLALTGVLSAWAIGDYIRFAIQIFDTPAWMEHRITTLSYHAALLGMMVVVLQLWLL